ncbi:MFS transporter [Lichenicola sp.]|uniref:MFS transporter n=1 Tax=Lichenicola sp. TaxID=2804529 RepID=UPI003AFFF64A
MPITRKPEIPVPEESTIGRGLTAVFSIACGMVVANIYYAQALIGPISASLHLAPGISGAIVTLTQLGYALGLLLLVPLTDLTENRRLIQLTMLGAAIGLAGIALSGSVTTFLIASVAVGLCSVGTQVLVPFAAHLAPERVRGRVIGNVMGGLITGIMLARPVASLVADRFGWRAIFVLGAVAMLSLMVVMGRLLPKRAPAAGMHYGQILLSMVRLPLREPAIRRRAAYQGLMFAGFSLFWTAVPLLLAHRFGLGQQGIALFALAGAGGALASPVAGRVADRGWIRPATGVAMGMMVLSFLGAAWAASAGSLVGLAISAIVLDAGVQSNQIVGQRVIYGLAPDMRGRINAIYMTLVFLCGSVSSMLSTITYAYGGWHLTAMTGVAIGGLALLVLTTEFMPASASADAATARTPARP